jgi:hypothetical protein
MEPRLTIRPSDSLLVRAVTKWEIGDGDRTMASPDGCWDLVIMRTSLGRTILLTGQTTHAVPLAFAPGDEILTISFPPGAYLAPVCATELVNSAMALPRLGTRFQLGSDYVEIPTFENVEEFIRALTRKDLLQQDQLVASHFTNRPMAASPRSIQRHFLRTTGLTRYDFHQIMRARTAAELLQKGVPAVDVAFRVGYADQAHLARSLKAILGRRATEIAAMKLL